MTSLLVLAVVWSLSTLCIIVASDPVSPIVIVPGILGNQLEAKLNLTTVPHFFCRKTSDWFTIWLSIEQLLPGEIDCLSKNLKLKYDPSTGKYSDNDGVQVRVPGFATTDGIEYLDPSTKFYDATSYFHKMVQHFVDKGYTRGKDIVGAPCDWRLSPNQLKENNYYANLKALIEKTYSTNNNQRVVLVVHSMGAINTLFFLSKYVTQGWKDTYLRTYVTIAGVWRGAAKSAKAFATGDNEGIPIDRDIWDREGQRSSPSTAWLLPYPSDTWTDKDVLVVTAKRNYTAWDYEAFFQDMGYPRGYEMFQEVKDLTGALPAPNLTTYCIYGGKVDTPHMFIYGSGQFPDTDPTTVSGDGDGTVNINSLMGCEKWIGEQPSAVVMKQFTGIDHVSMIKDPGVIAYVDNIVYGTL